MAEWSVPVPGAPITQQYGIENSTYKAGYHTGIDYGVGIGTPVGSAAKGTVVQTGSGGAYGNFIIIRHPNGMYTLYAHLSRVGVQVGQRVREGQRIGASGNTGNSKGPHLHFEVRKGPDYGSDVNPSRFFGGRQIAPEGGGNYGGNPYKQGSLMHTLYKVGFRDRGLAIAYAVAMAESGGRPRAHNGNAGTGDNSYGLFQINMLGAMGPERRERYGLDSNRDLFDPVTNARIAYKMSNGGKDWGAWTTYTRGTYKQYLDAGLTKASRAPSGGGGRVGGRGGKLDMGNYGYVQAFLDTHPQVAAKIEQARREGWTEAKLQGEIKETNWWKNRTEAQRRWDLISAESPEGEAKDIIDAKADDLKAIFSRSGVKLTKRELKELSKKAAINDWDEGEMMAAAARFFDMTGKKNQGPLTGVAGETVSQIDQMMYDWGIKVDRHTKERWTKRVLRGDLDVETMEDKMREQAKALFPSLAKDLDVYSVRDMLQPYLMVAADELGIPPEQMSTFDPKWLKPLKGKNENQRMDMDEWLAHIRNDKKYGWDNTANAREMAATMAYNLGKAFQVIA